MRLYTFADHYRFCASDHEDFLRQMWAGSFSGDANLTDYMNGLAFRIWAWDRHYLRVHSIEIFVSDLITVGVVKVTETN